eukprot:163354-Pelagomonas_calceolata.AAC.9
MTIFMLLGTQRCETQAPQPCAHDMHATTSARAYEEEDRARNTFTSQQDHSSAQFGTDNS